MIFKIATFSFLCFLGIFLIKGKENLLDKFSAGKIICEDCPFNEILSKPVFENILEQPFTYLGKGRQCFVFLSNDKKYVLKFVRQDRLKVPLFGKGPLSSNAAFIKKEKKRESWEKSYFLAYEKAKDLTGILYMQLGDRRIRKSVCLHDSIGREIFFPLEHSQFILQKAVAPLENQLINLRKKGEYIKIQNLFDSYLECLRDRLDQKIINKTRRSIRNMGVSDDTVIEFDIGEWDYDSLLNKPFYYNEEVDRFTAHFEKWIDEHIPECKVYFNNKKSEIIK